MFANSVAHNRPIPNAVATAGVDERVTFLRKTYGHLFGAILAFAALEYALLSKSSPLLESVTIPIASWALGGQWNWLLFLGLFMVAAWVADRWAHSDSSRGMQYLGLGLYVVAEALIFAPMLLVAEHYFPGVIADAAILTLFIFAGLTATVFITKKDFSFLRGALSIGFFAALGIILAGALFNFQLGLLFVGFMLVLACGYILYQTSQILAHYPPTHYVAASLGLFAAVALLFWYVVQLLMALRD